MELSAELIGRDGSSRPLRVTCEEGTLRGVLRGLERLQGALSTEMTELVEREKGSGAAHNPDSELWTTVKENPELQNFLPKKQTMKMKKVVMMMMMMTTTTMRIA
ncbi:uncharacterized protein LOC130295042 isoform X1 [Hyla sarda]|uniref:uncharacterized protein LOC130295042 isoform X1 n=1 Tax=Hyla sarda TaxID=327740 RepID=UPI0024C365F3|nr:uncharacterized protein LOC130295042 isoform X1 [Hyla sarda]